MITETLNIVACSTYFFGLSVSFNRCFLHAYSYISSTKTSNTLTSLSTKVFFIIKRIDFVQILFAITNTKVKFISKDF